MSIAEEHPLSVGYGAVLTALAVVLVYAISLHNGFAFDDVVLIPNDHRVTGVQIGRLLSTSYWNDPTLGLYRPLTSVTFALEWYVSRGSAAWFHFSNMLWHMLASVLAYVLLTRFFRPAAATFGGLLFAVHPVHVEAVANIVGRAELIAAVFFFAACLVWTTRELSPLARALLCALCYALAMCAKESAVVLPAVLWLLDYGTAGERRVRARIAEYAAIIATLAAYMLVRHAIVGGMQPALLDPSIEIANPLGTRIMTALQAWPIEARLLLLPTTLLADYGPHVILPLTEWTPAAVVGLTLLAVTVLGGISALVRRQPVWALALLWVPVTIITVSNLILPIGVLVAERALYMPAFAVCIAIAAVFERVSPRFVVVGAAVIVLFAARSIRRIPDWQSTDTIMSAQVRDRPDSFRGQWHMARMARTRKDVPQAIALYDRAIRLWPYREGLIEEAAAYGGTHGQSSWARGLSLWGTKRWPHNLNLQRMLAANSIDLGDTLTARRAVVNGLRLSPHDTVLNDMWRAFGKNERK